MQLLAFLACIIGFATVLGAWSIWRRSVISRRVENTTMRGLRELGERLPWDEEPIQPLGDEMVPALIETPSWDRTGAMPQTGRLDTA